MEDISILNPKDDMADDFDSMVGIINNLNDFLEKKNYSLRQACNHLLLKLIFGEFDASELDIKELEEDAS